MTVVDVVITDQTGLFEKITGALSQLPGSIFWEPEQLPPAGRTSDRCFFMWRVKTVELSKIQPSVVFFEDTLESFLTGKDCPTEQISAHRKEGKIQNFFHDLISLGQPFPHKSMCIGIFHSVEPL